MRRDGPKQLVDSLRTRSSLYAQGARFVISGCIVALVYLFTTTVLAFAVGLPFELALAAGFATGIFVHFNLQRRFVWAHHAEFALPVRRQLGRYLPLMGMQYAVTALSTAVLPSALGLSVELVYLVTAFSVAAVNFLMFRHRIFYGKLTVADAEVPLGASLAADPRALESA